MKTTVSPVQFVEPVLLEMLTEFETSGFTVIVIVLLDTLDEVTQPNEEVITQVMVFPFVTDEVVYVLLFVPTGEPFRYHWYVGVPPFVGVAVNVTLDPAQIVVAEAEILTDGVTGLVIVIVTVLLVAVGVVKHIKLLVSTHDTVLPFVSALFE